MFVLMNLMYMNEKNSNRTKSVAAKIKTFLIICFFPALFGIQQQLSAAICAGIAENHVAFGTRCWSFHFIS